MTPLRVGFLGYENACALDIVGPAEAFAAAIRHDRNGNPPGAHGRWRMHGDELIQTDGKRIDVVKIISLNEAELVVRN
ncbi:MAG: hypothetical protein ACJ8KX_09565, partial [Chthoniobacterales bacterium]